MAGRLFTRLVDGVFSLTNTLAQSETNGASLWGTSSAPQLGFFLDAATWGARTVAGSRVITDMPDTGVTRYYNLTVARQTLAPDGVPMSMLTINGQFPGPLLEANWGDWIEVTVQNEIYGPEEGTSMHWHGLDQRGTPWMDGVGSVSHCPIVPGNSFTYRIRADHFGSSWYHSHYSAQYSSGAWGPLVVHGPLQDGAAYDIDIGPVMVSDWYHSYYVDITTEVQQGGQTSAATAFRPTSDSTLVQGKGYYPCSNVTDGTSCGNAGLATFEFTTGKVHRLRFANTASQGVQTISIDNHTMTVIANDWVPIVPYQTQSVTLGVGQRTDVIVEATGDEGESYWLRSWNNPSCDGANGPDGRAVVHYTGAGETDLPACTDQAPVENTSCANDPLYLTQPVYVEPVVDPDTTITITLSTPLNSTGSIGFAMNGVPFEGDFNEPILQDALKGATTFAPGRNVYNVADNTTVRIIFINSLPVGHPLHLHGHDFQVLAEGNGTWDGSTIVNPQNPQRRDAHINLGGATPTSPTYTVLQYTADNPGVWPFHCHIAWHVSAGMAVMLQEQPENIPGLLPQQPSTVSDLCTAWNAFSGTNFVTDDDSTLKR